MKALSLSQPWAHVVMHGPKNIENRKMNLLGSARALIGQRIAIHAAKSWDDSAVERILAAGLTLPAQLTRGAIIGFATIADVFEIGGRSDLAPDQVQWTFGPVCIELTNKRALETQIPCRGMLGFWVLPPEVRTAIAAQCPDLIPELVAA